MKHEKKPQRLVYSTETEEQNKPPQWKPKGQKRAHSTERLSDETKQSLLRALDSQFNACIRRHIAQTHSEEDLPVIKEKIKETTPRGVVSKAEDSEGVVGGTLDKLLLSMGGKDGRVTLTLWNDYVDSNFDAISDEYEYITGKKGKGKAVLKHQDTGLTPDNASSSSSQIQLAPDDASTSSSQTTTDDQSVIDDDTLKEQHRTCSTLFYPLLRDDISEDIRNHFIRTLEQTINSSSDYIKDFSVQVMKVITLLKSHTFVKTNEGVDFLPKNGINVADLLPPMYKSDNIAHLPPPLNLDAFSGSEVRDFNTLFTESHLQLIHSTYFGPKEITPSSLENHPCHKALAKVLPRQYHTAYTANVAVMKKSFSMYKTNFENMWSNKKRISKTIDNVIGTLLLVKLAPNSEKHRMESLEKKKAAEAASSDAHDPTNNPKSRNRLRGIFLKQQSKQHKYLQKVDYFSEKADIVETEEETNDANKQVQLWSEKASRRTKKIKALAESLKKEKERFNSRETASSEDSEMEDVKDTSASKVTTADVSKQRLVDLRQAIRRLLFNYDGKEATEKHLKKEFPNVGDGEIRHCLFIANLLLKYIPTKSNFFKPVYQIPFLLMANTIFQLTHFKKFQKKPFIVPKINTLNALVLDVNQLFGLFGARSLQKPMDLFDYDERVIKSVVEALQSKDAVFLSFFDAKKVNDVCNEHKIKFGHIMKVLPGMKTIQLVGTPISKHLDAAIKATPSTVEKKKNAKSDKELELDYRIALKQGEVDAENKMAKDLIAERKQLFSENNIREAKKEWIRGKGLTADQEPQNNDTITLVNEWKEKRDAVCLKIQQTKERLQIAKMNLRALRQEKRSEEPNFEDHEERVTTIVTKENYKCMARAEDIKIDQSLLESGDIDFCGVDNGLVKMTETVSVCINDFKSALKSYLDQEDPSWAEKHDVNCSVERLPSSQIKPFAIFSRDLARGSGASKLARGLEKELKHGDGKALQQFENKCVDVNPLACENTDDLNAWYQSRVEGRELHRAFYYSKKRVQKNHKCTLNKRRFYDTICSKERRYASCNKSSRLIMLVGDRGYGVNSPIKGHLKYGGKWKPTKHSLYSTVAITNEHNSSQTCICCFKKLLHPLKKDDQGKIKEENGSFYCPNPKCPLRKVREQTGCRDKVSAIAIALSGIATLLFGVTFPCFDPKSTKEKKGMFVKKAIEFLKN